MLKIKLQKVSEDAAMPIKGTQHAACYDVFAHSITGNGNKYTVGLGFKTEIPKGYKGIIVPRSNLTKHFCQHTNVQLHFTYFTQYCNYSNI